MECRKAENRKRCNCSYEPCSHKGVCCECVANHLRSRELPGCFFPAEEEKTWDRSFEHFARLVGKGKV